MSVSPPAPRGRHRLLAGSLRSLGRLLVILSVALVVIQAATLVASSPLGGPLTALITPAGAGRPNPTAGSPASFSAQGAPPARPAAGADGAPGGRAVPNPQRGLPDVARSGLTVAGLTALVAVTLRRHRSSPRLTPARRRAASLGDRTG